MGGWLCICKAGGVGEGEAGGGWLDGWMGGWRPSRLCVRLAL